nr:ABC transporter ATP-binding protein [bacterium]
MLEVRGLTKFYGRKCALDRLDLNIETGSVFGFVGHNGAGKTTAMRILATLMPPDAGSAVIDGVDILHQPYEARKKLGYMPDFFGVYDKMRVDEYLDFYGDCQGMPKKKRVQAIGEMLELVRLEEQRGQYVDTLSRGMKQRLCLARCLLHDPVLIILDEPASGLDPAARAEFKEMIRQLKEMGKSVMISSHILPELAEMVDTVGILHQGQLRVCGTMEEIQRQFSQSKQVQMRVLTEGGIAAAVEVLRADPNVGSIRQNGNELDIGFGGNESDVARLLGQLVRQQVPVVSFQPQQANLEQIFLEVVRPHA